MSLSHSLRSPHTVCSSTFLLSVLNRITISLGAIHSKRHQAVDVQVLRPLDCRIGADGYLPHATPARSLSRAARSSEVCATPPARLNEAPGSISHDSATDDAHIPSGLLLCRRKAGIRSSALRVIGVAGAECV